MTEKLHEYVEKLKTDNADWVVSVTEGHGEVTVVVPRESIVDVCRFLKEKQGFDMLASEDATLADFDRSSRNGGSQCD